MRYSFLIDENILYHAVRGVDKHDKPDETAAEFVRSIARICHTLTIHRVLLDKYWRIIQKLKLERSSAAEALAFISMFLNNLSKRILEFSDLPELPAGVVVPTEDAEIVRAALITRPIIVTADEDLRASIMAHRSLGLRALGPKEALDLARQNLPDESH
ncbi:MAG: hypothetical protein ACRD3T_11955 [Terriglobia bacterium]